MDKIIFFAQEKNQIYFKIKLHFAIAYQTDLKKKTSVIYLKILLRMCVKHTDNISCKSFLKLERKKKKERQYEYPYT